MAIDFPNSPVAGSTYTYQGVTYTWIDTSGGSGADGYWKVNTPGTLGPATGPDLDAGTDNALYATALALEDSGYVKDQYYGVVSYYMADEDTANVTGTFSNDISLGGDFADCHGQRMGDMVMLTGALEIDSLTSASPLPNDSSCQVDWDITSALTALGVTNIVGGNGSGTCTPVGSGVDFSTIAVEVRGVAGTRRIQFNSDAIMSFPSSSSFNTATPASARFQFSIMLQVT